MSLCGDEERSPESVSDTEVEDRIYSDPYIDELHWEDFEQRLDDEFTQHIGKEVKVEAYNMGWRNLSGHKEFTINKPIDVFNEVIPNTSQLTFKIDKLSENKYTIRISHHDSPMGEHYELTIKE